MADGQEAVALYRQHQAEIAALLLDVQLPGGMDGPQILTALQVTELAQILRKLVPSRPGKPGRQ